MSIGVIESGGQSPDYIEHTPYYKELLSDLKLLGNKITPGIIRGFDLKAAEAMTAKELQQAVTELTRRYNILSSQYLLEKPNEQIEDQMRWLKDLRLNLSNVLEKRNEQTKLKPSQI